MEAESEGGQPRLRLLVHPAAGPLDSQEVAEAFLKLPGSGSGVAWLMELQWREIGLLPVERQAPLRTASGKIQHLHASHKPQRLPGQFHRSCSNPQAYRRRVSPSSHPSVILRFPNPPFSPLAIARQAIPCYISRGALRSAPDGGPSSGVRIL